MPWYWTDDLARCLVDRGLVGEAEVVGWMSRPVAFTSPSEADALSSARRMLGLPDDEEEEPVPGAA